MVNQHYVIQKRLAQFALKHREIHHISKSAMESIVNDMREIMIMSQNAFAQSLLNRIPTTSNFQIENTVDSCEVLLNDMFNTIKSARQLKRFCIQHMQMIVPRECILHTSFHNHKRIRASFCYVSILESLRHFLSHHDVGAEVIRNARKPCSSALFDYRDGSAFKDHPLFGVDSMAIRLHFYVDDFEVCNPIGSQRAVHELMSVYFVVGNVHPKYWSQSSGIHLALLARTQPVKNYGLEKILEPLIADLKVLESDGICVQSCDSEYRVRGSLATISADNLGSHQVGGFRQTFSSGKMCRFCMIDFENLSQHVTEEHCVLRTADRHASHLDGISVDPTLCSTYGVKNASPFNELTYFSVTESLPPDAMHDILEGLCPINVCFVLQCLIKSGKLTAKRFNEKLDLFAFSQSDMATKPPHVPDDIASRGKLACSASQNWCLFRNLPFCGRHCGL